MFETLHKIETTRVLKESSGKGGHVLRRDVESQIHKTYVSNNFR